MDIELLAIERILIEELVFRKRGLRDVSDLLDIDILILKRIEGELLKREIIILNKDGTYQVNKLAQATDDSIKYEIKEYIENTLKFYQDKKTGADFRFKKVSMNYFEHRVLLQMFFKIDEYLEGIEQKSKLEDEGRDILLFWGSADHLQLVTKMTQEYIG